MKKSETRRKKRLPGLEMNRREFVSTAAGAGLAVGAGLFGGQAPAFAQSRTVHVLAWSHFIPDADKLVKDEFAKEFKAASGVALKYETINANGIPARATAAVESGTGPDVFQLQWNQATSMRKGWFGTTPSPRNWAWTSTTSSNRPLPG